MILLISLLLYVCACCPVWLGGKANAQTPEEAKQQIQNMQKDLKKLNGWAEGILNLNVSEWKSRLEGKEKTIQELLKKIQSIQDA